MITRIHFMSAFLPVCLLMLPGNIAAQVTTLHTFNGPSKQSFLGQSISGAGDVNKDGHADIIVGAQGASPGGRLRAGQATVFSGQDGSVIHRFDGLASGDDFGVSVSGAGDVNKDGFPDLIVGAYLADPQGRMSAGQATVFSGKNGSVIHTFNGVSPGDMFGNSVAGAGDVNGDGYADLIVGAFGASGYTGQVTVFSGRDGSVLHTFNGPAPQGSFGLSVAGAGDVNRDNVDDVIVGGGGFFMLYTQATVFSGTDGKVLHTFKGVAYDDGFGLSVAGAGDLDRDGFADVIVGACCSDPGGRTDAGRVLVFSGRNGSTLFSFEGRAAGDNLGMSVARVHDVNKDGYDDLIVGAWGAASGAGQALVFSGRDGAVLATFQGQGSGSGFGRSVADVGDMNRDSFPELAVGAPMADPGGLLDSGQATVYSIPTTYIAGSGNPGIGGTVTLDLLAPGDQSLPFQVGSSLGTGPIVLGSRALGLSLDGLLAVSVDNAWPSMFQDYRGVIDGNARARAALHIPNLPALIGTRVHTAFVTLNPQAPFGIQSISNTETITIAK